MRRFLTPLRHYATCAYPSVSKTQNLPRHRPQLLVGDWAGTFIDKYSEAPIKALGNLLGDLGICLPVPILRQGMGLSKLEHIRSLLNLRETRLQTGKIFSEAEVNDIYRRFVPQQLAILSKYENVEPISGTIEVLRQLRETYPEMKVGVTTGYDQVMSDQVMATLKAHKSPLLGLIDQVIPTGYHTGWGDRGCRRSPVRGRPYPDGINYLMDQFAITDKRLVWKLDDTPVGIEEGQNAGCVTVGLIDSSNEMAKFLLPSDPKSRTLETFAEARRSAMKSLSRADYKLFTINELPETIANHKVVGCRL